MEIQENKEDSKQRNIDEVIALYKEFGHVDYAANQVSLIQHSLQAAQLALQKQKQGDDEVDIELVLGSLFHDVGKIILVQNAKNNPDAPVESVDHEQLGANFLKKMGFSQRVQEICRGHVQAKRYLCWKDPEYYNKLHEMSKAKLKFQGGPMTEQEAKIFEQSPFFKDIMEMRKFDEEAVKPGDVKLKLDDFVGMMKTNIWSNILRPISGQNKTYAQMKNDNQNFYYKNDIIQQSPEPFIKKGKIENDQIYTQRQSLPLSNKQQKRGKNFVNSEAFDKKRSFVLSKKSVVQPNLCALEHEKNFLKNQEKSLKAMRKLLFVAFICLLFMIAEFIGGYISHSLAITTDAAHMLSDVAAFMISYLSVYIAKRKASHKYSLGCHRAEIIGVFISIFIIWGLIIWLDYEAVQRIIEPGEPIDGNIMLGTASFGLMCNLLNIFVLGADELELPCCKKKKKNVEEQEREKPADTEAEFNQNSQNRISLLKDHDQNQNQLEVEQIKLNDVQPPKVEKQMNVQAALIHLFGDMVQSIGVITASIIIKFRPDWQIADPICTFLFSILVMITTIPIFKKCIEIIMEASPDEIDTIELYNRILKLDTVDEIHDFHCWSLAGGKFIMTCHVRSENGEQVVNDINKICREEYEIFHTTIQVEKEKKDCKMITCDHI